MSSQHEYNINIYPDMFCSRYVLSQICSPHKAKQINTHGSRRRAHQKKNNKNYKKYM